MYTNYGFIIYTQVMYTNYGFIIYTQVMYTNYKLRLHYNKLRLHYVRLHYNTKTSGCIQITASL